MIEGDVTIIVQAAESFNVAAIIEAKDEAEAAAAASAASEAAAAGSATSATASAASASGSASAAAGSASGAAASETAAATSETNAATSAGEAAASAASIDPALFLTKADNLASVANAATARTNLGLAIGTNVQAWDADLDAIAALATSGIIERTGAGTAAIITKPAGALVGTTDTQTLSGKTLTSPVLNGTVTGTALADQAAAEAGTGTGLMTSTRTAQAIAAQTIGVDQTWQDVSASRAANTTYQNTTGRPIMVSWQHSSSSSQFLQVSADNVTFIDVGRIPGANQHTVTAIVPPDHYYKTDGGTIARWSELR